MTQSHQLHAVVIAGGSGTRFWPLSRRAHPKQLLNLSGEDTLLHATFARVQARVPDARWWMVVGAHHADGCRKVAPEVRADHVLVEPVAKNTAPAIALGAVHLMHHAPSDDTVMAVLPADHHVADGHAFTEALERAAVLARQGAVVTLGITPTAPETGFGYIQQGAADARVKGAFAVEAFCEKPDRKTAEGFLKAQNYVWNAGIFVMQPKTYMAEVERQLPDIYQALMQVKAAIGKSDYDSVLARVYDAIKGISIDYGVMEHARGVAVVPTACGWSDVGSWSALGSVVPADKDGNVVRGQAVVTDTKDCVVYASDGHMVATLGLEDMVVVHTPDTTMVLPKARAQEVKDLLEVVQKRDWKAFL